MNAQLLAMVAEMENFADVADRCDVTNAVPAIRTWAQQIAALAAPKEAGDGDALSEVTLTYAEQRKVIEHTATELRSAIKLLHSVQQRIEAIDCQPLKGIRLAAPSKEAGDGDAVVELRQLYRAYVRLLESGMDRIHSLGGKCDPVDYMERNDPDLIRVRQFLANQPVEQRQEGA